MRGSDRWLVTFLGLGWLGACSFPQYGFESDSGASTDGGAGGATPTLTAGRDGGGGTSPGGAGGGAGSAQTGATGGDNQGGDAGKGSGAAGGQHSGAGAGGVEGPNPGGTGGEAGGSSGAGDAGGGAGPGGSGGHGGEGSAAGAAGTVEVTGGHGGATEGGQSAGGASGGAEPTGGSAGSSGSGGTKTCSNHEECPSKQCDGGSCRPDHCGNGALDSGETDKDCGGTECRPCGYGKGCQNHADCASALCSGFGCDSNLRVRCSCDDYLHECDDDVNQLVVDLLFDNAAGSEAVDLSRVTLHYFYSIDSPGNVEHVACESMNFELGSCAGASFSVMAAATPVASATHEVAVAFDAGRLSAGAVSGPVGFTISGNPKYVRSNDYSFHDLLSVTDSNPVLCPGVVVKNELGTAIWGDVPGSNE